jgi:hypothetical protein
MTLTVNMKPKNDEVARQRLMMEARLQACQAETRPLAQRVGGESEDFYSSTMIGPLFVIDSFSYGICSIEYPGICALTLVDTHGLGFTAYHVYFVSTFMLYG